MNIINLTPHPITICLPGGEQAVIPPSGRVARVTTQETPAGTVPYGPLNIPVVVQQYGQVEGLPPQTEDTVYVVSALVAQAAKRADVLSPGSLIRDTQGNVIGCRALVRQP